MNEIKYRELDSESFKQVKTVVSVNGKEVIAMYSGYPQTEGMDTEFLLKSFRKTLRQQLKDLEKEIDNIKEII